LPARARWSCSLSRTSRSKAALQLGHPRLQTWRSDALIGHWPRGVGMTAAWTDGRFQVRERRRPPRDPPGSRLTQLPTSAYRRLGLGRGGLLNAWMSFRSPWGAALGYGLAGQAGVSNPPSPVVSGALPTSLGIRPEIGPPFAAEAGVVSVWLAPSLTVPTQRRGVMPWTCAAAGLAGSSAIPIATASATSTALDRLRGVLPPAIRSTSSLDRPQ
jgi:hypothetical protein